MIPVYSPLISLVGGGGGENIMIWENKHFLQQAFAITPRDTDHIDCISTQIKLFTKSQKQDNFAIDGLTFKLIMV
mgnify:FL=1